MCDVWLIALASPTNDFADSVALNLSQTSYISFKYYCHALEIALEFLTTDSADLAVLNLSQMFYSRFIYYMSCFANHIGILNCRFSQFSAIL